MVGVSGPHTAAQGRARHSCTSFKREGCEASHNRTVQSSDWVESESLDNMIPCVSLTLSLEAQTVLPLRKDGVLETDTCRRHCTACAEQSVPRQHWSGKGTTDGLHLMAGGP